MPTKRTIDRRLGSLEGDGDDSEDVPFDVREGVTAPFVTFDEDAGPDAEFLRFEELEGSAP